MVKAMRQENVPTWKEVIGDGVLIEYKLQFAVNFSYGDYIFFPLYQPVATFYTFIHSLQQYLTS